MGTIRFASQSLGKPYEDEQHQLIESRAMFLGLRGDERRRAALPIRHMMTDGNIKLLSNRNRVSSRHPGIEVKTL